MLHFVQALPGAGKTTFIQSEAFDDEYFNVIDGDELFQSLYHKDLNAQSLREADPKVFENFLDLLRAEKNKLFLLLSNYHMDTLPDLRIGYQPDDYVEHWRVLDRNIDVSEDELRSWASDYIRQEDIIPTIWLRVGEFINPDHIREINVK